LAYNLVQVNVGFNKIDDLIFHQDGVFVKLDVFEHGFGEFFVRRVHWVFVLGFDQVAQGQNSALE
jgi:hypothetical protein